MPSAPDGPGWRVLVALLVYNGESFVGPCLESLARLEPDPHQVDVLVLDDASPAPGWSERCRQQTEGLGMGYYRTPRNLGIPRNMNLGLLRALDAGYDAVILLNSDTVVPANLVPALVRPLIGDPGISSTTAWSTHVSIFSLPNDDPDRFGRRPELVDLVSTRLDQAFDGEVVTLPSAVGFCMAIPTAVLRQVGLMDPVFGRGYSEEIDWCLRSHGAGFRSVLAPSCFVWHAGSGITKAEGLIGAGDHLVHAHQAIIDLRYPGYRAEIAAYVESEVPAAIERRALEHLVLSAARDHGYQIEATALPERPGDADTVRFVVDPDHPGAAISGRYQGFRASFAVGPGGFSESVAALVGRPADRIRIFGRGPLGDRLAADPAVLDGYPLAVPPYGERVF
jgi:GT2 family glycosyltransferase